MLTLDGHCKTLDKSADGYVRAETCIVLHLLASSPDAAAGDSSGGSGSILLRGTFVNQDGRSSSLTAPNGPSQQEVIRAATAGAGMAPAAVSGLSMHGTGEAAVRTLLCALPCQLNACMHTSGQNAHP
jgi:acyl transferase domain-containing protein